MAHDRATSNVLAWSAHASNEIIASEDDAAPDADEPDLRPLGMSPAAKKFQKSAVRKVPECASLLTRALQSPSDDDSHDNLSPLSSRRRRSMASTVSIASTAEYTCDTGLTTPARTSSPSPRLPQEEEFVSTIPPPRKEEKKRCISFACAAPRSTATPTPTVKPAAANVAQKKSSIRFACNARPTAQQAKPEQSTPPRVTLATPPTVRKYRSPSAHSRSARSVTPKRSSNSPVATRKGWFTADSKDLQAEGSRFHEFASDEFQDDDWIRQDERNQRRKLTIDDTLVKELAIRKLGKEAEEEAEQEEAEDVPNDDEAADDLEDDEDVEDEEEEDVDAEDDVSGYGSDHESSAGYRTDEEVGFADSDDDQEDDLVLWWPGTSSGSKTAIASFPRPTAIGHSLGNMSDSSAFSPGCTVPNRMRIPRSSRVSRRPDTPELPDSTDFVCGTLDEDRPLEDEYMSCLAAKRQEKLRLIPQDIDPSFPTSDPEDDDEDEVFKPLHRISDENVWLHGELEDLDHEGDDRQDRSKKKVTSPRRMHSPPPKTRGRSPPPRRLFDRQSPPRRMRSPPPPMASASPQISPVHGGQGVVFKPLAFRPGPTVTKSLPRAPAIFTHLKNQHLQAQQRKKSTTAQKHKQHVRGAIDIVKGLEQRRQRRREKLSRQLCNRARKGLAQEKRPAPGKGAERMRELGLLMAGKIGPGNNYVISV